VAAVEAALDNVRKHAGPDAQAWVVVDDLGADVIVTVRDNGLGVSQERIDAAAQRGRLGVVSSIKGRIEDLGGRTRYLPGPGGGTMVEMWIPKERTAAS
jgi:signal transduction histidine kinase